MIHSFLACMVYGGRARRLLCSEQDCSQMETRILLARHGQTDWNRDEAGTPAAARFRGRIDLALSDYGEREAAALAARIAAEYQPTAIYSSPLRRALQTARAIAQAAPAPIQIVDDLADIDYGAWQGLTAEQADARDPDAYRRWLAAEDTAGAPGGERLIDVSERAWSALARIAAAQAGAYSVAVSHDVVIKLIITRALGRPVSEFRNIPQHTAALNLLIEGDAGWRVAFTNDVRHLAEVRA